MNEIITTTKNTAIVNNFIGEFSSLNNKLEPLPIIKSENDLNYLINQIIFSSVLDDFSLTQIIRRIKYIIDQKAWEFSSNYNSKTDFLTQMGKKLNISRPTIINYIGIIDIFNEDVLKFYFKKCASLYPVITKCITKGKTKEDVRLAIEPFLSEYESPEIEECLIDLFELKEKTTKERKIKSRVSKNSTAILINKKISDEHVEIIKQNINEMLLELGYE